MGKVIAVTNQKGGVGKTTTAVNLSALLAALGQKTLLIDLDSQGNASSGCGLEAGDACVYEVLMERANAREVIEPSLVKGLDVLPADGRLASADLDLVSMDSREHQLEKVLKPIRDDYAFILIDCPPSLSLLTINALTAADSVLIPIQCEYYALEGLSSLIETITRVRRTVNPSLSVEGILLTMLDGRTNLGLQVVDEVKRHFGNQVYQTTIPRSVRLGEAPSHGEPIHVYDERSTGAVAYRALAEEVLAANGYTWQKDAAVKAQPPAKKPGDKKKKSKKKKKKN